MRKNILVLSIFLAIISMVNAQQKEQEEGRITSKGKWLIESNTGFGNIHPSNTGMSLKMSNGSLLWNVGAEGGYFIADGLAIKLGLGFGNIATGPESVDFGVGEGGGEGSGEGTGGGEAGEGGTGGGEASEGGSSTSTTGTGGSTIQGIGAILSYKVGAKYYLIDRIPIQADFSGTNVQNYNNELGFQAGYAIFPGGQQKMSIEPGIRYSLPLSNTAGTIDNMLQMNVGFSLIF